MILTWVSLEWMSVLSPSDQDTALIAGGEDGIKYLAVTALLQTRQWGFSQQSLESNLPDLKWRMNSNV